MQNNNGFMNYGEAIFVGNLIFFELFMNKTVPIEPFHFFLNLKMIQNLNVLNLSIIINMC